MTAKHQPSSSSSAQELARQLRLLRLRAGLSGHALADQLGITQASVSRVETGNQRPSPQIVEQWAKLTKARKNERTELWALVEQLLTDYTSHRVRHANGLAAHQQSVLAREADVKCIRVCQPALLPGLVQTTAYARYIFHLGPAGLADEEVERSVQARQERQGQLFDESRRFEFLIFEQALWATFAPKNVMIEQFRHLLRLAEFPNIWIGIVPQGRLLPAVPVCAFQSYDEELVTVETLSGVVEVQNTDDIAIYLRLFDQWADLAVQNGKLDEWVKQFIRRYTRILV